jgi:hypothetical protein
MAVEPVSSAIQTGGGEGWEARRPAVGALVPWDRRATSLPLLLLGGATAIGVALQWPWGMGYGLAWLTIPVAFAAVWVVFRFRAVRAGAGPGTFSGAAPMLGLFLLLAIVGFLTTFLAGPFWIFGVGLLVTARWQRSAFLAVLAVVIGGIGVLEGFFGITNRLPLSLWAEWEHPAIFLILGLLTVLAGIAAWVRENRAS